MIKVYNVWSNTFPEFAQDVIDNAHQVNCVIFDCLFEIDCVFFLERNKAIAERFFEAVRTHNISCVVLTISSKSSEWFQARQYPVRVIDWPNFYFTFTYYKWQTPQAKKINATTGYSFSSNFDMSQYSCTVPYAFLNRKARLHRAMVMDLLAKNNLLDTGLVSWLQPDTLSEYKFEYWQEEKMVLDQEDHEFVQETVPQAYSKAFVQLVAETEYDRLFITEKTIVPLMLFKPFLVVSCPGFHQHLQRMGFKLYDELFDYGFDSEPDHEIRFTKIVENIQRVAEIPVTKRRLILRAMQSKLAHNKHLAVNYAQQVPDAIRNVQQTLRKNLPEYGWASLNIY